MGVLYERWRAVAANGGSRIALVNLSTGESWSFAALWEFGESSPDLPTTEVPMVRGREMSFIVGVLRAWKHHLPLLPLDAEAPAVLPSGPWLREREVAHVKQTSGSTGLPRLVLFNAAQLLADADQIVSTMGLRSDWPNIGVISLAHSYGFSNLVLPLLLHGIPLRLGPDPLPASVTNALAGLEAATLPAVPAMWKAWRDTQVLTPVIQLAISAGAPLSLDLETSLYERCGLKVHNFYGSSECGGIAYDRTEVPRSAENLAGTALNGVSLQVGEEGRLAVVSASVGMSYWPEDQTDLEAGKFLTSDLVRLSDEGAVFLAGRATDIINVAGRKVNPVEIEAHLQRHPAVKCCLVFGQPSRDEARCEEIVALVSLRAGTSLAEVKASLTDLPAWQCPRHWQEVPELAPDHRGKLARAAWRAKLTPQT